MKPFRSKQRPKKSSLVIGQQQIIEAFASGKSLDRIFIQNNIPIKVFSNVMNLANQMNVPINKVPVEKLNGFNITGHGGIVALLSKIKYYELQDIISFTVEKGQIPLFILLDGITDIRNIGAIARTSFSMGVHALIIPDKGVGALNEDAITTSAGALELLPVCRVNSMMKAVDELHLNGIKVFGSEMKSKTSLFNIDFKEPVAIIMGSEEKGIHPSLLKICDQQFFIPMIGDFESLNVSVATGMILYETMKQRQINSF